MSPLAGDVIRLETVVDQWRNATAKEGLHSLEMLLDWKRDPEDLLLQLNGWSPLAGDVIRLETPLPGIGELVDEGRDVSTRWRCY